MKRVVVSVLAIASLSGVAFAGGDFVSTDPVVSIPAGEVEETGKNFYVGLGLSGVATRAGSVSIFSEESGQDRTGNLMFMAGYEFNPYIAVEGRYSTYIAEEDFLNSDTWGIYAKPQYPVSEDFTLYALLGFGGMTVERASNIAVDVDDTGFQWGLGASYAATEEISIFVDYVSVASGMEATTWFGVPADVDAAALTLGVSYRF